VENSVREAEVEEDPTVQWTKKAVDTEAEVVEVEVMEKEAGATGVEEEVDQMTEAEAEGATLAEAEAEVASTTREAATVMTTEVAETRSRVDTRSREELAVETQTNTRTMNELILSENQPMVEVIHCSLFKNLKSLFK